MQAAAPAVEVTRLLRMRGGQRGAAGRGRRAAAHRRAVGVFIALWTAVRERRADLAMLRMLGAPPAKVAALLLAEALWLALLASVLGLAAGPRADGAGRLAAPGAALAAVVRRRGPAEAWIPVAALLTGGVALDPGAERLPGRRGPASAQVMMGVVDRCSAAGAGAGRPGDQEGHPAAPRWRRRGRGGAWNRARPSCQQALQASCKGLAIGKYCGMRHEH